MARNTKLTPESSDRFIKAIRLGLSYKLAAQYAGVDESSIYNWLKWGKEKGEGIYFEFFNDVKSAEAEAAVGHLAVITRAAQSGTWQAAAWYLERRYPSDWGRKDRVDQKVEMVESVDTEEERAEKVAQLLKNAQSRRMVEDDANTDPE